MAIEKLSGWGAMGIRKQVAVLLYGFGKFFVDLCKFVFGKM